MSAVRELQEEEAGIDVVREWDIKKRRRVMSSAPMRSQCYRKVVAHMKDSEGVPRVGGPELEPG